MVYIDSETNTITIPRHSENESTTFSLELTNNIGGGVTTYSGLTPSEETTAYMYVIPFHLEDVPTGEYTYKLIGNGGDVAEFGLLNYGNYVAPTTEYNNTTERIQYNG